MTSPHARPTAPWPLRVTRWALLATLLARCADERAVMGEAPLCDGTRMSVCSHNDFYWCTSLSSDTLNCGACERRCGDTQQCVAGTCVCAVGTACGMGCFDLARTLNHCGGCGQVCDSGFECADGLCVPRLIEPASGVRVARGPLTFRWSHGGARVEVCSDRTCDRVWRALDSNDTSARLNDELDAGVYFWRVRPHPWSVPTSQVWSFRVDARRVAGGGLLPPSDDLDGDGLAEVVTTIAQRTRAAVFLGRRDRLSATADFVSPLADSLETRLSLARAGDLSGIGRQAIELRRRLQVEHFQPWTPRGERGLPTSGIFPVLAVLDADADGLADALNPFTNAGGLIARYGTPHSNVPGAARSTLLREAGRFLAVNAGDVNGDGFADALVGAPTETTSPIPPSAFVLFGSRDGFHRAYELLTPSRREDFAASVASAGDVDGDGHADLLVRSGRAGASVYLGGTRPALHRELRLPSGDDLVVSRAGDVNGDGYSDLVAVPIGRGEGWLYFGAASGVVDAPVILRGSAWNACEGPVAAPGDIDGDGLDDVYYGVPSRSEVRVLYGSASAPLTREQVLSGERGSELGLDILW